MFDSFKIARYRVTISAGEQGLILPPYKGSTFRGGFGHVFKRICCALRQNDCLPCILREQCVYAYVFETSPPGDAEALRKYENIPRPFVIEPPLEKKTDYLPGEILSFNLLLFGKAISYLPHFILTFRELGQIGLGRNRRPFNLLDITAVGVNAEEPIYDKETNTVSSVDLTFSGSENVKQLPSTVSRRTVEFETFLALKDKGSLAPVPHFHIFFRQTMRRISALSYFHQEKPLEADYTGLAERSHRISLVENKTIWQDFERFSRRQQQRMHMGGLVGTATYEGELGEFLPWLALGEQVHVGKNAVFGHGKYRMRVDK